jgi:hypothetical protein
MTEEGFIKNNVLTVYSHGRTHTRKVPENTVYNWAIFDLIQRMSREKKQKADVAALVDMDELKDKQKISARGKEQIPFADSKVNSDTFLRIGSGERAWLYYTDPQGRLLIAITGILSYILLDEKTAKDKQQQHQQVLEKLGTFQGPRGHMLNFVAGL